MFFKLAKAVFGASLVAAAFIASPSFAGPDKVGFQKVVAVTSVPYGWVDFCQRYRGECDAPAAMPRKIGLSAKTLREIERINRWVNKNIESVSDMDHWSVIDQWDYPTDGRGDCEDFALLKRKLLAEQGFPMQALLLTVVKDKNNEGHAVLTVHTDHGDYVLDNMNDEVKDWKQTGYRFVKRQSQTDMNTWVSIGEPTSAPAYASR
ncbi:MAG: transglutaminase-like cysteine peptidase [Rhodoblastus sp.]